MPSQPAALSRRKAPRQRRSAHTVDAILEAAALVLGWLQRADFGEQVVADVRQP